MDFREIARSVGRIEGEQAAQTRLLRDYARKIDLLTVKIEEILAADAVDKVKESGRWGKVSGVALAAGAAAGMIGARLSGMLETLAH